MNATVVGGGLAGSEAAWALAERGVRVTLYEMRPVVRPPAHQTDRLAELVCSNSFKSVDLTNAHGLLKAELRAPGQPAAPLRRRGAGAGRHRARGGPRACSPRAVHERVTGHPSITVVREEVTELPSPGDRRHRSAHLGRARRGDRRAARRIGARVLRRHRADRRVRFARPRAALRALPLRQGRRRRLPQRADDARGLRARSSTRSSRPTSSTAMSSTRCRTSRAACRSRRWRGAAARRCASGR